MQTPTLPGLVLSDLITAVMTTLGVDPALKEISSDEKAGHFPISADRPQVMESVKYIVAGYLVVNSIDNSLGYENPEVIWGDVDVEDGGIETLTVGFDPVVGRIHFAHSPSY